MSTLSTRSFASLVSTEELASSLDKVKILDGSWHMPNANRDPYQEFIEKRIANARFFGIDQIKDTSNPLPHMLPSPEVFANAVGQLGISNDDQIVVYDSAGVFSAARVYWTFKVFGHQNVSVLNGGLPKWIKENRPTESGPVKATETKEYKVPTLNKDLVRDFQAVLANAKRAQASLGDIAQVLDARPHARFTGEAPEPRPGLSSGHMPGSISVPFNEVIANGELLPEDALRDLFLSKGIDLNKNIVTSCGSGITASILYLALERAGAKHLAVYDGSWTEYADQKDSIIVKHQ
ncbi:Rhodanese-like domain-containing protein [Radiomyces spectabilis]|uniref:Rhodanese-like domain-containing protein n=1 Tax=Radiomyces spectabilis TaxID=64574 RepID=UPI00221E3F4B|nr:Rhodanese-like domain-containing protein [Radiomyces spectabilis]KAI8379518.1 Rhodanese-like domain-containing protein [Radiomyces spectabilis]